MTENSEIAGKPVSSWPLVLFHLYLHLSALYGLLLVFTQAYLKTSLFTIILISFGLLAVTIGNHRMWAHQCYKAVWPLKVVFAILQMFTCQGTIYDWVRDHRLHHKHHGTDDDPYNYKRGFTFAQWSSHCLANNPRRESLLQQIDMSDIEADKVVMFQKRFYWFIMPVVSLLLPINAAVEYWGESLLVSVMVVGFLRIAILLQASWLINSATLLWGLDPMDKKSGESWLVFIVNKSLWPQYHYLLPWDYQSGEFGTYAAGCSTAFIRVLAALGLIFDLTTITSKGVKSALSVAAQTKRPLAECLYEARDTSSLAEILNPTLIRF
jgi:stearoyl-CoA desaturase (delta-9 desaturase)